MLEAVGAVSRDFVNMIPNVRVLLKPESFQIHLFIIVCRNIDTSIRCYLGLRLMLKMKKWRLKMKEHP